MAYDASTHSRASHERLQFAIFLALALHVIFILGLSFEAGQKRSYAPQLEVTLTSLPSKEAQQEARLLAAENQLGSGNEAERDEMTSREPALEQGTEAQQSAPAMPEFQPRNQPTPSTATASASPSYSTSEPEAREQPIPPAPGIDPEIARLSRELASLEARLDAQSQAYSSMPRVRRLTSVSAKRAVDAAYLLQWRQRVEAVGNKYYPEASERYGIYGSLRLLVVIRRDGSLENIEVLSSSGHAVLDEAAIKIVRLAAPFAPFPSELAATTDKLEIIRTWQFQENGLSSG